MCLCLSLSLVGNLTLADLNIVLFRYKAEEEADGNGFSVYNIPSVGEMTFCGLRGKFIQLSIIKICFISVCSLLLVSIFFSMRSCIQ